MKIKRRYRLLVLVLLLVVVNVTVYFYDYRVAFLEQNNYKLDKVSSELLAKVDEPLIITLYKSDNLPPRQNSFVEKIREILAAYQQEAKVPIHLETIDPTESVEAELEAMNAGIQSKEIKDEDNALSKIYTGLMIQKGGKTEVLPFLTPRMSVEYLISSSLRRLMENEMRKIGVIQGHGEPPLTNYSKVMKMLSPNYDLVPTTLALASKVADYESLLIISPKTKYSDAELELLDAFLGTGKNIFLALDRVDYYIDVNEGYKIDTRLEEWLVRKGLLVNSDFIVDNSASNVNLPNFPNPISFPYFPQIMTFEKHPATRDVSGIILRFASSIEFTGKSGIEFTSLAKTSKVSGKKSLPLTIDFHHKWTKADYLYPEQTVAAVIEGNLSPYTEKTAKIMVISDGDLVRDVPRNLDNSFFVANAIDWLSDSYGLVALKTKGVMKEEKVKELEISSFVKFLNLFLPLLTVGGVAMFFSYRRKKHIENLRTRSF